MKAYFEQTTRSAIVIWATTTVEILIAAILYISLRTAGIQESISLLIALFTLVGLIILGFLLFQTPLLKSDKGTEAPKSKEKDNIREEISPLTTGEKSSVPLPSSQVPKNTSSFPKDQTGAITRWVGFSNKTLWDWLQLLIVSLTLAIVAFEFNAAQEVNSQRLAAEQYASDQQLALDQQRQTILATYLDHMSSLLPTLLTSKEGDGTRAVARVQTLVALLQLDSPRKKIVVMFLYQAGLINVKPDISEIFRPYPPSTILQLNSADLSGVDLSGVDIHGISLDGANLGRAHLSRALLYESNLYSADLSGANLEGANLNGSFLGSANLRGANLTNAMVQGDLHDADLSEAKLNGANLKGANLKGTDLVGTDLRGAKYNTREVQKTVNGITYKLVPTLWPEGFDPAAAGAIADNSPESAL